jgi:hypothetical protein
LLYAIARENVFIYAILAILLFSARKNISPAPTPIPSPIPATINVDIKKLEQAILALNNEIIKMRTEAEWKSEARSGGLRYITNFDAFISR